MNVQDILPANLGRESPARLRRAAHELGRTAASVHFHMARLLAHVHEQPQPFGYSSGVDFGEAEMKLRERTAWMLLALERDTRRLPKLRRAWERGEVSYSNAREVAKVATPETDAEWTALAAKLPYRGIYARVHDRPEREAEQGKRPWPDTKLSGEIGRPEKTFQVQRPSTPSLMALEKEVFELHNRWAGQDTSFREFQEAQLLCYRDFLRMELGQVPAGIREVMERDGWRCSVPHCRRRATLEGHHTQHRSLGGGSDPDRICSLCALHHAAHHAGLLEITGNAKRGFRFRHREAPDAAWGEFPPGGDIPFDPFERAWDGPSYVREAAGDRDRAISSFEFSWPATIRTFRSLRM